METACRHHEDSPAPSHGMGKNIERPEAGCKNRTSLGLLPPGPARRDLMGQI